MLFRSVLGPILRKLGKPVVTTGILSTNFDKLAPLAPLTSAWVPQVYVTRQAVAKWNLDPARTPAKGVERYRERFGADAVIEVAGAAYDTDAGTLVKCARTAIAAGSSALWWWYLDAAPDALLDAIAAL